VPPTLVQKVPPTFEVQVLVQKVPPTFEVQVQKVPPTFKYTNLSGHQSTTKREKLSDRWVAPISDRWVAPIEGRDRWVAPNLRRGGSKLVGGTLRGSVLAPLLWWMLLGDGSLNAQHAPTKSQAGLSPSSTLRPLSTSPSPVVQVAYMQSGGPSLPPDFSMPSDLSPTAPPILTPASPSLAPAPPSLTPAPPTRIVDQPRVNPVPSTNPPTTLPPASPPLPNRNLVPNPQTSRGAGSPLSLPPPSSNLAAIPYSQRPEGAAWATVGNSPQVSPAPVYQTGFWGCNPAVTPSSPIIPIGAAGATAGTPTGDPYRIVPPTAMPNTPASLAAGANYGPKPLLSLGQEKYNVQLGRGIFGQPKAYVPGQKCRNFLRYLTP